MRLLVDSPNLHMLKSRNESNKSMDEGSIGDIDAITFVLGNHSDDFVPVYIDTFSGKRMLSIFI